LEPSRPLLMERGFYLYICTVENHFTFNPRRRILYPDRGASFGKPFNWQGGKPESALIFLEVYYYKGLGFRRELAEPIAQD
jgi:hypothetical protein